MRNGLGVLAAAHSSYPMEAPFCLPEEARPGEESGRSLIVKLPYNYYTKCANILQRWCEPVRPFDYDWNNTYDSSLGYIIDPEYFLRNERNGKIAE